jgi:hypothetical protein
LLPAPLKGLTQHVEIFLFSMAIPVVDMVSYPLLFWQLILATLERVIQITVIFVFYRLAEILILDVFPYLSLVQAHGTHIIPPGPELVTLEILSQPAV